MKYFKLSLINPKGGTYFQPISEIHNAIDGEFDGAEVGTKIEIELVEMDEEEYKKLPEFSGH